MRKYILFLMLLAACTESPDKQKETPKRNMRDSIVADSLAKAAVKKEPEIKINDTLDAIADIIAGIDDSTGIFREIKTSQNYRNFSSEFSERWKGFDSTRITKLKAFRDSELVNEVKPAPTLFYPFSGPDILYANIFFPKTDTFILFGLEPVGLLPDLANENKDSLKKYFKKINTSLNAILKFSFFRTESMSKDLKNQEVNGTVHLLFLFLKRTGNDIVSAKPMTIDSTGKKVYYSTFQELKSANVRTKGVEIKFKSPDNKLKELNYYSFNAADQALKDNKGFSAYLAKLNNFNTYLKGASYLLHKSYFSIVRNTILDKASVVIQDDSGIDIDHFLSKGSWDYKLYGNYTKPISLFAGLYQKKLDSLYKANGSTNLGFGIGYNFKDKNSNLMIARRK